MEPLQNYEQHIILPVNTTIIPLALASEQYKYDQLLEKSDKELVNILGGVMLARLIQQQYNPSKESVTSYILQALQTEEISQEVLITKILQLNNAIHEQNPELQVKELLDSYDAVNSYDYEPEALIAILEESLYFQENSHSNQQNSENILTKLADTVLSDPNQVKNLEDLIMKSKMILSEDCYALEIAQTKQIMERYLTLHELKFPQKTEERIILQNSINGTLESLNNILNTSYAIDVKEIINNIQNIYLEMINQLGVPESLHIATQKFTFSTPYDTQVEEIGEFGSRCLNEIMPIAICYSPTELKSAIELLELQLGHPLEEKNMVLLAEFPAAPRVKKIRYMTELILAIYMFNPNINIPIPDESRFEDYDANDFFYEKEFIFAGKHIFVARDDRNKVKN
jgi:hypothetical protein